MATLIYKWPLDDGTGTSCSELVAGVNTLAITAVSGYPTWEAGGGLCFGTANGGNALSNATNLPRAKSTETTSTCSPGRDACALSIWLNMSGLTVSRPLFGVMTCDSGDNDYERFQQAIYIGTDGKPAYAFELEYNYSSLVRKEMTATDAISGSSDWHHILAWQDNGLIGDFHAKLYVDGALVNTYTGTAAEAQPSTNYQCFKVGSGVLRDTLMSDLYANTDYTSNGAFGGILKDARVYCGTITDDEVKIIYDAGPNGLPAVTNALMFSCNT